MSTAWAEPIQLMSISMVTVPYLATATLCGVAGAAKVRDARLATAAARQLGMSKAAPAVVLGVACLEVFLCVAAWTGAAPVITAAALAALFATFSAMTVALIRSGRPVSCGCFGVRSVQLSALHVALNIALTGATVLATVWPVITGNVI